MNTSHEAWPLLEMIFPNTSSGHRLLLRLSLTNLRHTLYLISPNETMFETVEDVPNYNTEVSTWWLVFIAMEFIILLVSGHCDRFALNDSITSMCAGILSECFKFGGRTIAIFGYVYIWNHYRLIENEWNSQWTWIFCLFLQDFMYYLGHRAVHEFGFFWGFHAMHHSSEYYNYTTALRQGAIQDVGVAIYDCLQAFFIPPSTFLVHRYFCVIYQFTLHTSLFDNYGPLGIVLNTPSHHRVHHGRNPYCIDRNYGGVFIIWDKLFGTFEPERTDDRPVYGLITREKTFNQLWLQFHTLKELLLDKWRMKDEKGQPVFQGIEKLKAIFFPPGYFPGSDVFLFFHWWTLRNPASGVPEIEDKVVIFNPPIPLWLKIYCFLHFLILLDVFTEFEHDRQNLQWSDFWLKLAFFIATMQCFGAIFDRSSLAPLFELLRCIGVLLYYANLVKDENGVGHHRFFMIIVLAFSSTASVVLLFTTLVEQLLSNSVITSIVNKSLKGSDSPSEVAMSNDRPCSRVFSAHQLRNAADFEFRLRSTVPLTKPEFEGDNPSF